ncbi:hypothetical protein AV920_0206420 [Helicobacter pylori]|nr:hypothetical protein AV923_0205975 [Helicobacter pylori]OJZ97645.1 hypothetical protein AV920_0206420 [Helicobacter pylori]
MHGGIVAFNEWAYNTLSCYLFLSFYNQKFLFMPTTIAPNVYKTGEKIKIEKCVCLNWCSLLSIGADFRIKIAKIFVKNLQKYNPTYFSYILNTYMLEWCNFAKRLIV